MRWRSCHRFLPCWSVFERDRLSCTGQPTGIFTANGGTVGVTAGSAIAITVDNLIDLIYALKSPYRRNTVFLMRDVTVSALRKLKDNNGA